MASWPGLEALLERVKGQRVGLISGPSGWLGEAGHLADRLHAAGVLRRLFAPEHGVRGERQAGEAVADAVDSATGLPVHSLYGGATAPAAAHLADLDVLVGCLQDCGFRPYTYPQTLGRCLRAGHAAGVPLVLLDRPTPLGGRRCAGNVAAGHFFEAPLPLRPGLTIGEQLRWLAHREGLTEALQIIPLSDWRRDDWFDQTGLPWVPPSPNLPTLTSAVVFGATVMLEATNVSEGRGTPLPFELLGAPWLDGERLARDLNRRGLPGLLARPAWFRPTFSKYSGELCAGVQLHVLDRERFDQPAIGLHLLDALCRGWPDQFEFRPGALRARYHDDCVTLALRAGADPAGLLAEWRRQAAEFAGLLAAEGLLAPGSLTVE